MTQLCALEGCYDDVSFFDVALCYNHVVAVAAMYSDDCVEWNRNRRKEERSEQLGCLYFVRVGERIKVGWSRSPRSRLRQYPPGSEVLATQFNLLIAAEEAMHVRLTQWRDAGREWYRDCPEVRAAAAEIVAEHGKPEQIRWGTGQRRGRQTINATRGAVRI